MRKMIEEKHMSTDPSNGIHYFFYPDDNFRTGVSYFSGVKKMVYHIDGRCVSNSGYKNIQEAREHAERILGIK